MKKKLLNFANFPVLVIGDIMLDKYWITKNDCILDEFSAPILKISQCYEYVGGAANVANNIVTVGGKSILVGVVGQDESAKSIKNILKKTTVEYHPCIINKCITTTKLRIMSKKKQIVRLDCEKNIKEDFLLKFNNIINPILKKVSVVILSDYNKGTLCSTSSIIEQAKKEKVLVLVDPKGNNYSKYVGSTLLTPNLFEFESIVGKCSNRNDLINKGMDLLMYLKLSALLITQSKEGMTLLQINKKPVHFLTRANTVVDVTGAGDTVIALIALGLSSGFTLEQSCYQANVAAGIVVQKPGTASLTLEELKNAM
ncbi:D-glycero-beta-D-manno-heptose-7-phosphate kinase [Buchnera aphidicola]|uniref:D-glycero-beta-D-manno-heptose-7-phosphate kinase n=1 Tax=Buchnera aphidicola (Anoecia oenotherae) TaxID=1241833 RepID=A0A4D6XUZ5_9GAMM|nr:D-glycero-beta-D-manno-heptose-7-phosphate kinase [Buchnera aphidicola]QCI19187.1 D-glycero-beta-D-manno-heptose-7-phosphate kinase [Buchnera aphidicola (Anoecia oenotherae)]